MAFVLDASVALAWCFEDETSDLTQALLKRAMSGEQLIVPAHWPTELLSALIQGRRRNRVSTSQIDRFLDDVNSLSVSIEDGYSVFQLRTLMALAERHGLSAYDAAYLDLAKRYGVPVATLDRRLREASRTEGLLLEA